MIVTTAGKYDAPLVEKAKKIANELSSPFISRKNQSLVSLQKNYEDHVLMVGKEKLTLHPLGNQDPLFFHPNSSMFRVKRLLRGEDDPFVLAASLKKGKSVLDCTLGLASDAIVASLAVGKEGKVVGIEANLAIGYLVKAGLETWESGSKEMDAAMRRITVVSMDHLQLLKELDKNSYDVVYFDPMFEETIASPGMAGLKTMAVYTPLSSEVIEEAKRVAKERVVLKDHYKSKRFEQFGFTQIKRLSAKFHYGTIELT